MNFEIILKKLANKENLSASDMSTIMDQIVKGEIPEENLISFLTLLRDKGETADEIRGAVSSLRKKALPFPCRTTDLLDTCGTGGDQKNTFNISTAAAFVAAGAGVPVAKHGNRAVSSRSGSADVLKELGVNIDASPEIIARCVDKIGIGFMFAPAFHPALKQAVSARKKIATKTIFNILGPLLNPAGAKRQVIGVYSDHLLSVVAQVLHDLGSESVAVVHGNDGMDELTLTTTSRICFLRDGKIKEEGFDPHSVGYGFCSPAELQGGTPADNARRLRKTLKGHSQPLDHCVHLNAALGILVYGEAADFKEALLIAQESVSSGHAFQKLEQLVEMTNN